MRQLQLLFLRAIASGEWIYHQCAEADAHIDVALIGGGIMSATLATLLRKVDPGLRMVAATKSSGWVPTVNVIGSFSPRATAAV